MTPEKSQCEGVCPNFKGKCIAGDISSNIEQTSDTFCYKNKLELDGERLMYVGVCGTISKEEYAQRASQAPYPNEAELPFERTHIVVTGDMIVEGGGAYFIQYPLMNIDKMEAVQFYNGSERIGYVDINNASSDIATGSLIPIDGVSGKTTNDSKDQLNIMPLLEGLKSKLQ